MKKILLKHTVIVTGMLVPMASVYAASVDTENASSERMRSEIVIDDRADTAETPLTFARPIEPHLAPAIQIDAPPPSIEAEHTAQDKVSREKPLQIAQGIVVPQPDVDYAQIRWVLTDGKWVGHFDIRAAGAATLRAALRMGTRDGFALLPDALRKKVFLRFGGNDSQVIEVSAGEISGTDHYWTALIPGDVMHIEVIMPSEIHPATFTLRVPALSYFAKPKKIHYSDGFYGSGACQQDVACRPHTPQLREASDSVAKMIYTLDDGTSFTCTGTLMNNQNVPKRSLFVTAKHCIETQAAARSLVTVWHYQTTQCGGAPGTVDRRVVQRHGGARVLYAHRVLDMTLLELNDRPPAGARYQGWSAKQLTRGEAVQAIHHPRGDAKKHSIGEISQIRLYDAEDSAARIEVKWGAAADAGVTEGGSSGSGLFTPDSHGALELRGTLFGGASWCGAHPAWRTDDYAPFSDFYPSVTRYFRSSL